MQQVQGGRFARALQSLLGTQGKLALQLDSVVVPTIQLADVAPSINGNPAQASAVVGAGGAGNRSIVQLNLPDQLNAYGWEIQLEEMLVAQGGAAPEQFYWGQSPGLPAATTLTDKEWRDTGLQGFPAAVWASKNNAPQPAGVPTSGRTLLQPNVVQRIPLDFRLVAGDTNGFMARAGQDNLGFWIMLKWREIPPA